MTARFTKLLLTTLAAARLIIGPVDAQTPRTMTLVDVLNVPRITNPQLSPDGRRPEDGRGQRAGEGQGRCVFVRRGLSPDAPLESGRAERNRRAHHERRLFRARLRALA